MERIEEEALKAHLMQTNEEFQTLCQQHSEYERIIGELEAKPHLTEEEQLEEVRLKKLKLQTKDHMIEIISKNKEQLVH